MLWEIGAFLAALVIAATLLSRIRAAQGLLRYFDFPRLQILFVGLIALPLLAMGLPRGWVWVMLAALVLACADQAWRILHFTPLWRKQSLGLEGPGNPERQFSVLCANIKTSNRQYDRFIDLVRECRPDILLVLEVDGDWVAALDEIAENYEHRVSIPLDNSYGMVLWSRLPLEDVVVRNLLIEDVPSIRAVVRLPGGAPVALFALHPEPPVPTQDTRARDAEIGLVGIETTETNLPAVVVGDLNDVAWSDTTLRFQRLSGLLDPRIGRGLMCSFDARNPLLRWPLDHLFHDARFRLIEARRLRHIGSDHFPMLFRLELTAESAADETPEAPRPEDRKEVEEMARTEAANDRRPIGEDWENG